ncbi:MAG TPA: hypothetical protein VG148_14470 [Pyrinomonadaceae bacterium]|nr:hypothetical protein [Pyrinomonadaceae bacterium]
MRVRAAKGRFTASEEISREAAWGRLTEMLGGGWRNCWLIPYVNFEPINTDRLRANVRLEAETALHGKYPCELTAWDEENKRFSLKIMYHPEYFTEYEFAVNEFMNGGTFIDARLARNHGQGLLARVVGKPESIEEALSRTLSYIPIKGRIDFVKAE